MRGSPRGVSPGVNSPIHLHRNLFLGELCAKRIVLKMPRSEQGLSDTFLSRSPAHSEIPISVRAAQDLRSPRLYIAKCEFLVHA